MRFGTALFASFLLLLGSPAAAEEPLKVVTTLSAYADIARAIGGPRVQTETIASPRFNPHFIEPRPSDVLRVKRADLFIHSGLDLEAWRAPLLDAAGRIEVRPGGARELDLSHGVALLNVPAENITRAAGDIHLHGNPHFWLSPTNGLIIARAIGATLAEIDPPGAETYRKNTATYIERLEGAIAGWRALATPIRGRTIVAYHDEWIYLTDFMGITIERFIEPKPGIPPSPQHIESIQRYMVEHRIPVIIQATFHPTEASEAVAERTGATVVRICQNVGERPEASTYIEMIDFDIRSIVAALAR